MGHQGASLSQPGEHDGKKSFSSATLEKMRSLRSGSEHTTGVSRDSLSLEGDGGRIGRGERRFFKLDRLKKEKGKSIGRERRGIHLHSHPLRTYCTPTKKGKDERTSEAQVGTEEEEMRNRGGIDIKKQATEEE